MKIDYLADRVTLEAESPLDRQLLSRWYGGRVWFGGACYSGKPEGPTHVTLSFGPKTAAQLRREKRAARLYDIKRAWRKLRSIRLRIEVME